MNRIATMTVIRGYGEVEAIVNGVVSAEIKRLQRLERERLENERKAMIEKMSESELARIKLGKMLRKRSDEMAKLAVKEKQPVYVTVYEVLMGSAICLWYKITGRVI